MGVWEERTARATDRYEDGWARLPEEPDERQRQLARMGNAAWAAGLSLLMLGHRDEARVWLERSAARYRESWHDAPPGSWGRPIGAMKAMLIAGNEKGAARDARWALGAGAAESESPIGRYAALLAFLVLGQDEEALGASATLAGGNDFPRPVADALVALSSRDAGGYHTAVGALLADFESRDAFLEDIPVADTVLVLQQLAEPRGLATTLASDVLPDRA